MFYIYVYRFLCVREGVKLRLDSNNDLTRFKYNRPMRTYNLAYFASLGVFVFETRASSLVATFVIVVICNFTKLLYKT
jgi:hypothetical protein